MKYLKVDDKVWNIIREFSGKVCYINETDCITIEYSDGSIDEHVYNGGSKFLVKMTEKEQVISFNIPAIERDIPADGTPVWVWDNDYKHRIIRISSGKNTDNGLICVYSQGSYYGDTVSYENWELFNPALSSDHKDAS